MYVAGPVPVHRHPSMRSTPLATPPYPVPPGLVVSPSSLSPTATAEKPSAASGTTLPIPVLAGGPPSILKDEPDAIMARCSSHPTPQIDSHRPYPLSRCCVILTGRTPGRIPA